MRRKTPGNRCRPASPCVEASVSPPPAEETADMHQTKLLCPSLTVMITKTVKALCEVNIRFDNKLEISGCLHVRSDGEKVLTCLIDEETARVKQEEEAANDRHEPIVSMLNNTLATALQTVGAGGKPQIPITDRNDNNPELESLEESIRTAVENSKNAAALLSEHASLQRMFSPASNENTTNDKNSNIITNNDRRNREELIGMMENDKPIDMSPSSSEHGACSPSQGEDSNGPLQVQSGAVFPGLNVKKEVSAADMTAAAMAALTQPAFPGLLTAMAPSPDCTPTSKSANIPTIDNIPYETMEVLTPKGSRTKKFQCMFCGIMLSTKGYLKNHINAVHTKARVYPCDICERLFYSAGALRIHKLRHHWAGSKKHKCHLCTEAFLLPIELRRHLLKKHGIPENGADAASPAGLDDSSSEPIDHSMNHGESSQGDDDMDGNASSFLDSSLKDAGLTAQLQLAKQAAQAHAAMVQDMNRISRMKRDRNEAAMESS